MPLKKTSRLSGEISDLSTMISHLKAENASLTSALATSEASRASDREKHKDEIAGWEGKYFDLLRAYASDQITSTLGRLSNKVIDDIVRARLERMRSKGSGSKSIDDILSHRPDRDPLILEVLKDDTETKKGVESFLIGGLEKRFMPGQSDKAMGQSDIEQGLSSCQASAEGLNSLDTSPQFIASRQFKVSLMIGDDKPERAMIITGDLPEREIIRRTMSTK